MSEHYSMLGNHYYETKNGEIALTNLFEAKYQMDFIISSFQNASDQNIKQDPLFSSKIQIERKNNTIFGIF